MKRINFQLLITFFLAIPFWCNAQTHYVRMDGTGNGTSWMDAQSDLQIALNNAAAGDTIWVASGIYRPVDCTSCTDTDRNISFSIQNEIILLGGFPSIGNPTLEDRDWGLHTTILSGDIGVVGEAADNSRRIIFSAGELEIEGFTIRDAKSDIPADDGAGIRAFNLIADHCIFENNVSINKGGAVSIFDLLDTPRQTQLTNCSFIGNTGSSGGAIYIPDDATCDFEAVDCHFENNQATSQGGVIKIGNTGNQGYFNRCVFSNNSAVEGGCIFFGHSNNSIGAFHSLFTENQASENGGVFNLMYHGNIEHCTFANNNATNQGNVFYTNVTSNVLYNLSTRYNIFHNNNTSNNFTFYQLNASSVSIYSNMNYIDEATEEVFSNLDINSTTSLFGQASPFVDPNGDFHLFQGSDAIDKGTTFYTPEYYNTDLDGNRRDLGFATDVGAYEFTYSDCPEGVVYVNASATGDNNGTSWEDAFTDLSNALRRIDFCPSINEIWIAAGTYVPTDCLTCNPSNVDPSDYRFWIPFENIAVFGGFPNTGNPTMTDRNWESQLSILSGNIGDLNSSSDNVDNVFKNNGSELDGLVISDAKEYGYDSYGENVTLTNCWIRDNKEGGAKVREGRLRLESCRFSHNEGVIASAYSQGYWDDGDSWNDVWESVKAFHCIFENNGGEDGGLQAGSVYAQSSLFIGNSSEGSGGAIAADRYAGITNCTFVNNSAEDKGAAIYSDLNINVWNSIFWENQSSGSTKAIEREGTSTTSGLIQNVLTDESDCDDLGTNLICTTGNIFNADDPFVSISNEDFQLNDNSQAIDAGDNDAGNSGATRLVSNDLNHLPRIQNETVDIGAYENNGCSFIFTHQSEIDDFSTNFPDLDTIQCDVYIRSTLGSSITNLDGLNQLISIKGFLWIENSHLTNLSGLDNLTEVGAFLSLNNNEQLTSLDELNEINTIRGYLDINGNENLSSINGLNNLTNVEGYIKIQSNPNLTSINGFENLIQVDSLLAIQNNENLTSLGFDNLTEVGDDLIIYNNDNLTTISSFNNLINIGSSLNISYNDNLSSINGFNNLTVINTELEIYQNYSLITIDELNNLTTVGSLIIDTNLDLVTIDGLNALTTIGSYLRIKNNDNLVTIDGLNALTTVGSSFDIYSNDNLVSFDGLNALTTIGSFLRIYYNYSLTSLDSLNALTTIGSYLDIFYNHELSSISGLLNLNSIDGYLTIAQNSSLTSLSGIDNIDPTGVTNLTITNNENLPTCHVPFVCNYLAQDWPKNVSNNASGCNNDIEVLDNCEYYAKINIPLFYDINQNGALDSGEPYLSAPSVTIDPVSCIVYGNPTNGGIKYLPFGNYTLSYNEDLTPLWEPTATSNSYDVSLSNMNYSDTIYFGLYPAENISNITSQTTNSLPRCNEFVTFDLIGNNNGTTIVDGTLWFTVDENILDINFIDLPDTLVFPNRYGWFLTDLMPENTIQKQISLQFPGPPSFPIGDFLQFETEIVYSDLNGQQTSGAQEHTVEVQCSYDPNDKLVSPTYPDNYALTGENLIYTIRFQNTGNAEAYNVVITDTIDSNFDLSTFQYIASSHEVNLSTFLEGNLVTFEFRDIFLPDSTTNFDESQGYVMYSIRANEDIDEMENVENTASIFFDSNLPVVTNTTENLMVSTFDADEDGVEIWLDCDDNNSLVNYTMEEEPYNGLDDDCNPTTLDDDLDQDGFGIDQDCDDNNPMVNIGEEEPYNGLDDDCDPTTLDDDLDQDGFGIDQDCDDNDPMVNIGEEEPYNGLDDDCDPTTLDDDLDQDGFGINEDCDDENPNININAEDIPNNNIDEDCDGEDAIVSNENIVTIKPQIFPNPTSDLLRINFPSIIEGTYEIRDLTGKLIFKNSLQKETLVNLSTQPQGMYTLLMKTEKSTWVEYIIKL